MAWLTNWGYRKSHGINAATGAGTLYQKRVKVYYGSGSDSGENVYLAGKCRTDFGDVRFTDDDGSTLLDYWMESKTDSNNAVFWVEVADSLESAAQTIYVYYGKADATTTSNGDTTFPFHDHFPNASLDLNKWVKYSGTENPTVSNSILSLSAGAGGIQQKSANYPFVGVYKYAVRARASFPSTNASLAIVGMRSDAFGSDWTAFRKVDASPYVTLSNYNGAETRVNSNWTRGAYQVFEERWISDSVAYLQNETAASGSPVTTHVADAALGVWVYSPNAVTTVDWILIRKYVSPEPAHAAWGSEEESGVPTLKEVTDSLGLADSVLRNKTFSVTDALGVSDQPLLDWSPQVEDTLALSDEAVRGKILDLFDAVGLVDDVGNFAKTLVSIDAVSLADLPLVLTKETSIADSVTLADAVLRDKILSVLDSLGLSDQASFPYQITGVTRDSSGAALGSVTLWIFRVSDKCYFGEKTSGGNGSYTFEAPNTTTEFFIVAFKSGAPDKVGTTYRDLKGEAA